MSEEELKREIDGLRTVLDFHCPNRWECEHRSFEEEQARIHTLSQQVEDWARLGPKMLDIIKREGFVFDLSSEDNPKNTIVRWQKLAFTLYSHLAHASGEARDTLDQLNED